METMTVLKEASERLGIPEDALLRKSFSSYLREQKRLLMAERFEMLSRYGVNSSEELKGRIEEGEVPEHPTWEDYIELTNLEDELAHLEDHLHYVSY
jgi:hypothetical protein